MTYKRFDSFLFSFLIALMAILSGCGPAIRSFTAVPVTITSKDSVQFNWDIRGTPTLLFHEEPQTDSLFPHLLYYKLVVRKRGKELARPLELILLPKQSSNLIPIETTLQGDTLVARDTKNPERWGNAFEVLSVATACQRKMTVSHAGIIAEVDESGTFNTAFAGTLVEGTWEFRSLINDEEKKDHTKAPGILRVRINIQRKII
jgi:hypothetical protein